MLGAGLVALLLVSATSLFHFFVLRWLSGGMARIPMRAEARIFVIVVATLAAHVGEIALYAAAYWGSAGVLQLGRFGGLAVERALDYLYFSAATYTSLGLGDIVPGGHLRFIAGIEALNGLLLIAWSGSFIYLAMGRLWPWQVCTPPEGGGDRAGRERLT